MARISPWGRPTGGKKTIQGWVRGGMRSWESRWGCAQSPVSEGLALEDN